MIDTAPDNVVDHLLKLFGTQARLAEAAGVKQPAISDKRAKNALTHGNMRQILISAPRMGVSLDPWDFFPEFQRSRIGRR